MSVAERTLKVLIHKKESIFATLQTLLDLSRNLSDVGNKRKFKALYQEMDIVKKDLFDVIEQIQMMSLELDEGYTPDFKVIPTINEICGTIRSAALSLKLNSASSSEAEEAHGEGNNVPSRSSVLMPKMELPEFSGDIRHWLTFYEIFKSSIHDNPNLNKSDKIHYLIGRLKGPALIVCSGIEATGENYEIIWNALIDRYHDKRFLANSYLEQILDFKPLRNDSSKDLGTFLERVDSAVAALKKLDLPDLSDFILFYLARSKLDSETMKCFDNLKRATRIPTYTELKEFISEQLKISQINKSTSFKNCSISRSPSTFFAQEHRTENSLSRFCIFCKGQNHHIASCKKFRNLTPDARYTTVKNNNWCYRCLSNKHMVRNCSSNKKCSVCSLNHHFLLHLGKKENNEISATVRSSEVSKMEPTASTSVQGDSFCSVGTDHRGTVLLSTAVVRVNNAAISNSSARFILDSGSQVNLVTFDCCKRLGLTVTKICSSVRGLGQNLQSVKGMVELILVSRYDTGKRFAMRTLVVEKITDKLPRLPINAKIFDKFDGLPLADNEFGIPGQIDGIIGAELFPLLLGIDKIVCDGGSPYAIQTAFGYVIMGEVPITGSDNVDSFLVYQEESVIENLLRKFFELENVPDRVVMNEDDRICEKLYAESVQRDMSGRFTVALPFKLSPDNLGNSKFVAENRLLSLEKRLSRSVELRVQYNSVMKDFIDQDHMKPLYCSSDGQADYYIAHHPVIKLASSSTPVRIVLDASAPSDNGVSLNDLLYGGIKLQTDICKLLLNFRLFEIALTGDICQMYRQIGVREDHWRFQKLLWRFDPQEEIQVYQLTVVGFGLKSSPFLALRTVKELLKREREKYPLAADYINRDLYMDDLVCSIPSSNEAQELYTEAMDLFAAGAFKLTKFSTNCASLLECIPKDRRALKDVTFKTDTKILGMQWNPSKDILGFKFDYPDAKCTKRNILSSVARCYDPLGIVAPVLFALKLLIKEMWRFNLDWDLEAPKSIQNRWTKVKKEIPVILIGFADASQVGYGGVVYLRSQTAGGKATVALVCAKSRISPSKLVSIPRLELCAALLLSKLMKYVLEVYTERIVVSDIFAFSDSSTVLQWLNCLDLKDIFVANRVYQIKENLPMVQWRHIEGTENPADCLSRGLTPSQLVNHALWKSGPVWLKSSSDQWPGKITFSQTRGKHPLLELFVRRSSWSNIINITVWVLRFLKILPAGNRILVSDIVVAEFSIIRLVQLEHFGVDIQRIESGKECSPKLMKLRPFLKNGLLRVGGRLGNSNLEFRSKHPLILPAKDMFTERLFNTPAAPHQGGLWESHVKSVKTHLYRVIGDQLLTYEELNTVLTQIEALLNSRPLCVKSMDPSAPEVLTPAHFLTQMPLNRLPTSDVTEIKLNRLDRYQLIDRMVQDFWKRWRLEYLSGLQVRTKWYKSAPKLEKGMVVLLKEENSPPLHWPLGVIQEVFPGKDGCIRNVAVKTSKGIFSRPAVKVYPLPTQ
nr:unnamed protein product [Callosobruchus analis]